MTKPTFEEWKEMQDITPPTDEERKALKELHGLDMDEETEKVLRTLYKAELVLMDNAEFMKQFEEEDDMT
jgi:hypothetical protein